ncbi:MAG: hypothetical protein U1F43_26790 [Myxococcota bacterium]
MADASPGPAAAADASPEPAVAADVSPEPAPDAVAAAPAADAEAVAVAADTVAASAAAAWIRVSAEHAPTAPEGGLAAPWKALQKKECKKGEDICSGGVVFSGGGGAALKNFAVLLLVHGSELGPDVLYFVAAEGPKGWRILDGVLDDESQGDGGRFVFSLELTRPEAVGDVVTFLVQDVDVDGFPERKGLPEGAALATSSVSRWWCWVADGAPRCAALALSGRTETGSITGDGELINRKELESWSRTAELADGKVTVSAVVGTAPSGGAGEAGSFALATTAAPFVVHGARR